MTATAPAARPMGEDKRPPALGTVVVADGADEVVEATVELPVVEASVVEEAFDVVWVLMVVLDAVLVEPVVLETVAVDSVSEAEAVDDAAVDLPVVEAVALPVEAADVVPVPW